METIITFFEDVPTTFRAFILIGVIFIFWVMEGVIPLFQFTYNKIRHAGVNLTFTLFTAIIGFGLAGVLYFTSYWVTENEFGFLHLADFPLWAKIIIGVMLLDFMGAWLIHWIEHKIKFEGQGVASKLMEGAFKDAEERDLKIAPICPFVKVYLQRHPEWKRLLAEEHKF